MIFCGYLHSLNSAAQAYLVPGHSGGAEKFIYFVRRQQGLDMDVQSSSNRARMAR